MRHNYVPAPYSIYKGFRKLRPGHFLVLADGEREPRIETYWSARDAAERATGASPSRAAATKPSPRSRRC